MVIGTDWSAEHHPYGATVVIQACVTAIGGGHVTMAADGHGIRVRPRTVAIDPSGEGVIAFHVTVVEGATGGIRVQQHGSGIEGGAEGPEVVTDRHGWHFARHEG